jgi:SH3-like domain-containing protein
MKTAALRLLAAALAAAGVWTAAPAYALDFRSVAADAAVLYDAPSARSNKLFVVNRGYPLEVIVTLEGWVKVRDANGALTWIDAKQLTDKQRTVMIRVPVAQVRQKPDDNAGIAFQAQQNVLLELVEATGGWLQVRHRDGGTGYVRAQQVWGV